MGVLRYWHGDVSPVAKYPTPNRCSLASWPAICTLAYTGLCEVCHPNGKSWPHSVEIEGAYRHVYVMVYILHACESRPRSTGTGSSAAGGSGRGVGRAAPLGAALRRLTAPTTLVRVCITCSRRAKTRKTPGWA